MATLTQYHGLDVIDGGPAGAGGAAIQDGLVMLVDWHPHSEWNQGTAPGGSNGDDGDDGPENFYPGSFWMNTSTTPASLYVCQSAAIPNAVWLKLLVEVVQDTTPQLGGTLDVNGQTIVSASNGNICIIPNGTGKVGIGTSAPSYAMDVSKEATGTYVARILNTSIASNCSGLLIDTAQNSPAALTVKSSGSTKFEVNDSGISIPNSNITVSSGKTIGFNVDHCYLPWDGTKGIIRIGTSGDALEVHSGTAASPTTVMAIESANNRVGIGTSSPAELFDVAGLSRAQTFTADGDVGSGAASTVRLTGVTDTPTSNPGWTSSNTAPMAAPDGYVKMYIGTQAVVIPFWNT